MSTHTPGPWDALTSDVFAKAAAVLIARADHPELAGYDEAELPPHIRAEVAANLRLMQAAPDLLEALTDAAATLQMINKLSCTDSLSGIGVPPAAPRSVLGMARAAITKATEP